MDRLINILLFLTLLSFLDPSFSELSESDKQRASAPVVDNAGVPSFKVTMNGSEQTLSAHDVAVRYIRSLFLTAEDFLSGVPIAGAVVAAPLSYSAKQLAALKAAATEAGLIVLQVIPAPAAAVTAYGLTSPLEGGQLSAHPDCVEAGSYTPSTELDRNVAVVDVGGSSTTITVLAARSGLYSLLSYVTDSNLGGQQVDDALVNFFAKEFTKKTKIPIEASNVRAWVKLRNEAEHTKRALSASTSAQCAVESLTEGVDFSGSINRIRMDSLAAPVYSKVIARTQDALKQAGMDPCQVDEIVLAGGSARLPGLTNSLIVLFPENGHAKITASIDADQVIARGCAVHASSIAATPEGAPERSFALDLALAPPSEIVSLKAPATERPFGLVLSESKDANGAPAAAVGGQLFVTLLAAKTPLPARRIYTLPASTAGSVLLSFAEGTPNVKVEKVEKLKDDNDDEDFDDDEGLDDELEEKHSSIVMADSKRLVEVVYQAGAKGDRVRVELVAALDGSVSIVVGEDASKQEVRLPAAAH